MAFVLYPYIRNQKHSGMKNYREDNVKKWKFLTMILALAFVKEVFWTFLEVAIGD